MIGQPKVRSFIVMTRNPGSAPDFHAVYWKNNIWHKTEVSNQIDPELLFKFQTEAPLELVGWGTSEDEDILQEAEVNVLTRVECAEHWGDNAFYDTVICSQDKNTTRNAGMCLPVIVTYVFYSNIFEFLNSYFCKHFIMS